MAETRDSRGKEPSPQKSGTALPRSSENEINGGGADMDAPVERRRGRSKSKEDSWFQQNQIAVIGVGAGVALLVLVVALGWLFGWFGGGDKPNAAPAIAQNDVPQPPPGPAPTPPPPQSAGQPSGQPTPEQPVVPETPKQEPQKPPLPENLAKWKPADYFRARRENDPKLIEAVVQLGEKKPNNTKAAEVLVELLKPLPPEPPKTESPAPTTVVPPVAPGPMQPQPVAPGIAPPQSTPPSAAPQPPAPGAMRPPQGMPMPPGPSRLGGPMPTTPGGMPYPGGMPSGMPNMPGGMSPGNRPYNSGDLTKLVEALVEAIGANGSALARNTLEQILAGSFATDDDKAAVEAALKTLAFHSREEYDALLLRVLTASATLRPASRQGPWTAKEMKAKAFELIKQTASGALRTKLAEAMIAAREKISPEDPKDEFLLASNPLNCGAQLIFYGRGDVKKEVKATIEQQFVAYSSMALAGYLKVPTDVQVGGGGMGMPMMPRPGIGGMGMPMPGMGMPMNQPRGPAGEPAKAVEVDPRPRIVALLWGREFLTPFDTQLNELRSLEHQPQLVMLAATIPMDSVRSTLLKTLKKRSDEGTKVLETAGLTGQIVTDPGLLVLVKRLPRKASPSMSQGLEGWGTRGAGRGGAGMRSGMGVTNSRLSDAAQKKQQTDQEWMELSAKLVSTWCKRFQAATTPKHDGAEGSNQPDEEDNPDKPAEEATMRADLPSGFALAPAAKVIASHHVTLPNASPADFTQVQPDTLEVYYVRAEEAAKPKNAIRYYCRQAGTSDTKVKCIDRSLWIDRITQGSQKDRLRTIDVLITKSETAVVNTSDSNSDDETDLTIEVLIIEIKDPSKT